MGLYEENGIRINREPFGPLTGTLIPPFMSHSVAIIEGLLALEQGVKSITVGYGQVGSLTQDIAAIQALRELSHEYFHNHGFDDYELSTVFHQWMGGFPEDEAKAFSVIAWGAAVAGMSGATKVITKSPHEAFGIPTAAANAQGLKASRQMLNMVSDQKFPQCAAVEQEVELIKSEVRAVLKKSSNWVMATLRAVQCWPLKLAYWMCHSHLPPAMRAKFCRCAITQAPSVFSKPVRFRCRKIFSPCTTTMSQSAHILKAASLLSRWSLMTSTPYPTVN